MISKKIVNFEPPPPTINIHNSGTFNSIKWTEEELAYHNLCGPFYPGDLLCWNTTPDCREGATTPIVVLGIQENPANLTWSGQEPKNLLLANIPREVGAMTWVRYDSHIGLRKLRQEELEWVNQNVQLQACLKDITERVRTVKA
jgi:hypothetical protein